MERSLPKAKESQYFYLGEGSKVGVKERENWKSNICLVRLGCLVAAASGTGFQLEKKASKRFFMSIALSMAEKTKGCLISRDLNLVIGIIANQAGKHAKEQQSYLKRH